ncbi:MAG: hypothetical protein ACHQNT_05755 [Bacteroidia bacterium]
MKKTIISMMVAIAILFMYADTSAQPGTENYTTVNVQMLKTKWPEKGTLKSRDSLVAIYNDNVIKKNEYIMNHREYSHWFTANNKDYMVIEEYKNFDAMEKSFEMNTELEKKAWPDEKKRKEFMDAMNAYFEDWHGDALYRSNPVLSK